MAHRHTTAETSALRHPSHESRPTGLQPDEVGVAESVTDNSPNHPSGEARPVQARPRLETGDAQAGQADLLTRIDANLSSIAASLARLADHIARPGPDTVDTRYVAAQLGCTPTWVAELARRGEIPPDCVAPSAPGTRRWKFVRDRIDRWLASR